ncbi:pyruvate carboxylase [Candidatus Haliotispira prima]|uniref:Pyruvate carboxylase n=1 Tax=Candidatus Haliotispira prima TaxID=3034016 RepID=A0ABY8MJN6_9SPIO|nr:pyruvate carboxylase [Candidatus Haliotispira prima]
MVQRRNFRELLQITKGMPILVANRGIPARRICRSVRERLKAHAIITATNTDRGSPAISAADEVMLLGADPTAYLDIEDIVTRAKEAGVEAIHPGWGFASEDSNFSRLCREAGITFIGPDPEGMELLGSKLKARALAKELGIPTVPGSDGAVSLEEARTLVESMELPILLKAEGGGGGRGIVIIRERSELDTAFEKAQVMAAASFGNPTLYVEKFLSEVHHIEIQVLADRYGNVLVFDERDCSLQRNHQKLLEITPSPWVGMSEELRGQLKEYSRRIVQAANYHTLATVEFLVTEQSGQAEAYLIEVNTRLQVEHGITESRYGIDLVEQQIAVALGVELDLKQEDLKPFFWSLQCRINLEDPQNNFSPNSGLIKRYHSPGGPGVRLDSNLSGFYEFPSNYDSAGSLLICYANSWDKLIALAVRALNEYQISGLKTTLPFYRKIVASEYFAGGDFSTRFIEEHPELLDYHHLEPEALRLGRLIAQISARGYNPYIKLDEYRSFSQPRLGLPRYNSGHYSELLLSTEDTRTKAKNRLHYPQRDRKALLAMLRSSKDIHFTDTTCRDITQSNSGNRMRLAEDRVIGPYLDQCGFLSLETGGGAHFHMNIRANMTSPIKEAREWRKLAPRTLQQVLVRSTNLLGYKPQGRLMMQKMGSRLCELYDIIRCFDFLNYAENMAPLAEVVLNREDVVFEPALSLSVVGQHYSVAHYLDAAKQILEMCAKTAACSVEQVAERIILGLKDMAGVCSPAFIAELAAGLKQRWPNLLLHYHRHATDGLFVPALVAAAKAGVEILDVGMDAACRWYGQGDVGSVRAALNAEGFSDRLNGRALDAGNSVLKEIMPFFDRYCAPHFQGYDYNVIHHGMPGGAISSSQEGAMQQGYIFLLPQILEYLAIVRRMVLYHDVTPGAQITWNNAFLAIRNAHKRGGRDEIQRVIDLARRCLAESPDEVETDREDRLLLFQEANDSFKALLAGDFGPLPLGFPPEWVYHSTFGREQGEKIYHKVQQGVGSPLDRLKDCNVEEERVCLETELGRRTSEDELLLYLNHPADTIALLQFQDRFGDPNCLPLSVWFEGLVPGESFSFSDSKGKQHRLKLIEIGPINESNMILVGFQLNHELVRCEVQVEQNRSVSGGEERRSADPNDPNHVGALSNGDLWVVHVAEGDVVRKGQELCNISIMKQEKGIFAKRDGVVKKVHISANFKKTSKMVSVREGDLILELGDISQQCPSCVKPLPEDLRHGSFCPYCGVALQQNFGSQL